MQHVRLLLCGVGLALLAGPPNAQEPGAVGAEAPLIDLPMLRGAPIDLAADRGKRVVVLLFVSHATRGKDPWEDLTPDLRPIARKHPDSLRIATVVTGSRPVARGLLAGLPPRDHTQVAHDRELRCVQTWLPRELRATTAAVIVDRAGRVAWIDESSPQLFEHLEQILDDRHDLVRLSELAAVQQLLRRQVRGHPGASAAVERMLQLDPGAPGAWSLRLRRTPAPARPGCIRSALRTMGTRPRIATFLLQSGLVAGAGDSMLPKALMAEIETAFSAAAAQPWLPVAQARVRLALAAVRGDPAATGEAAQELLRSSLPDPGRLLMLAQSLEQWCRQHPGLTAAVAETGMQAAAVATQSEPNGVLAQVVWLRLASRAGVPGGELTAVAQHVAASIVDPNQLYTCAHHLLAPDFLPANARTALCFLRRLEQTDERSPRAADWLATTALAHFHAGDAARAVRLQTQAIACMQKPPPDALARLREYETAAKQ